MSCEVQLEREESAQSGSEQPMDEKPEGGIFLKECFVFQSEVSPISEDPIQNHLPVVLPRGLASVTHGIGLRGWREFLSLTERKTSVLPAPSKEPWLMQLPITGPFTPAPEATGF